MSAMAFRLCGLAVLASFSVPASAGVVTTSLSWSVSLPAPMVSGSFGNTIGDYNITLGAQQTNGLGAGSSLSSGGTTISASDSGPATALEPLVITANGSLNGSPANSSATSRYAFSYSPSSSVTDFSLAPAATIQYSPAGLNGYAQLDVFEDAESKGSTEGLFIDVSLQGNADAAFSLNPNSNNMALRLNSGALSGSITVTALGGGGTLLDYEFTNSVVTKSQGSFGLPGVGAGVSFQVPWNGFDASVAAVAPGAGVLVFSQGLESISGGIITPEPANFGLGIVGLFGVIFGSTRRTRRYRSL